MKKINFPVYIGDSIYINAGSSVLEYKVLSINIDVRGKTFTAECKKYQHRQSFPEYWIGEQVFLSKQECEKHR